ncbi:MAG: hypothetical protein SOY30_07255 [Eubacteriales bacterium]|nr:hypothetical protein [Eubacteriales bacterium]
MAAVNLEKAPELDGSRASNERLRMYLNRLVEALAYVLAHLDGQNILDGGLSTAAVKGLDAQIVKAARAEMGQAKIGAAQIQDLEAQVAKIVTADIGTMDVDWANIASLMAKIAEIADARIGTAEIDFARIRDLIADKQIITQGEAGELYIADLAVTEGNMVRLSLGQLLLKGADGGYYEVVVGEDGEISARKSDVTEAIDEGQLSGGKLIDGSITAAKLNAKDIFADNAIIRQLMAANIDVDTLFSREATINAINAMDILANSQLRVFVDGQNALNEQMKAWFNFSAEGELAIGRSDQAYSSVVRYDGFAIRYYSTDTLYFKQDTGYIPKLQVDEKFTIGDLTAEPDGDYVVWT